MFVGCFWRFCEDEFRWVDKEVDNRGRVRCRSDGPEVRGEGVPEECRGGEEARSAVVDRGSCDSFRGRDDCVHVQRSQPMVQGFEQAILDSAWSNLRSYLDFDLPSHGVGIMVGVGGWRLPKAKLPSRSLLRAAVLEPHVVSVLLQDAQHYSCLRGRSCVGCRRVHLHRCLPACEPRGC